MNDTIAAIATATSQRAGVGIVRISGALCKDIAADMLGASPPARRAVLRNFRDQHGEIIDQGLALYFPKPGSYTGEDVLELHAHGGVAVLNLLLDSTLASGARRARPGEFTERAFLNGRIDLLQAEAVADLIDAGSTQSARAAQATLRGEFSRLVNDLTTQLTALRVQVEASFDFSDEDLGHQHQQTLTQDLSQLIAATTQVMQQAQRGVRLNDGFRVVLVGAPNVGKSSVLNRLAGEERAIVTAIPGTTRDVIRDSIQLDDVVIELSDTAGLHDSEDAVEQIGMHRAIEQAQGADLVLLLCDDNEQSPTPLAIDALQQQVPVLRIYNKIDLSGAIAGRRPDPSNADSTNTIAVSAMTGEGFDILIEELKSRSSLAGLAGEFSARQRHLDGLRAAHDELCHAAQALEQGLEAELVAEDLRQCQIQLGRITGQVSSDDLLGEIFSTFCLGK